MQGGYVNLLKGKLLNDPNIIPILSSLKYLFSANPNFFKKSVILMKLYQGTILHKY